MTQVRRYVQKGRLDKAMDQVRQRIRNSKENPRLLQKLAELQIRSGERRKGIKKLTKVAGMYAGDGQLKWAVSVYKQVLSLDAALAEVRLKLAEVYLQLERKREAARQIRLAGVWYLQEGRNRDYLKAIERLVEVEPENLADRLELAQHYSRCGDQQKAAAHYAQAALSLRKLGREFIFFGEHAFCRGDRTVELLNQMARVCLLRGEHRRALEKLERSIQVDGKNLETTRFLIVALVGEGRLEEAQSRSQAALDRLTAERSPDLEGFSRWLHAFEKQEGLLLLSWLGETRPDEPEHQAGPVAGEVELPEAGPMEVMTLEGALVPAWEGGAEGTDPGW